MRTVDRLPGSQTANFTLLWFVPMVVFALPALVLDAADGPTVLTDWRSINLSPAGLAGWLWLGGSAAWGGYSLWRLARSWVRGIRAGWRNEPLPPVDD